MAVRRLALPVSESRISLAAWRLPSSSAQASSRRLAPMSCGAI
ncbi:hypothetical protein ACQR1I_20250 [Bradyrhizobium sp. HKCCYLS2038]